MAKKCGSKGRQRSLRKIQLFRKMFRGIFFLIGVAFIGLTISRSTTLSVDPGDLNLLIVTVDTLRADNIGVAGCTSVKTPHIDGLARKGVLFTQTISPAPLTLPAHCSLFTGKLPFSHGVRDNGQRLPPDNTTLALIAKEEGLLTAAFIGAFPLDSRFGLDQGFEHYDDLYGSRNPTRDLAFLERDAAEVNRKAMEWISLNKRSRFFVWIHYFDPHAPYEPPPPFDREYAGNEYDGEVAFSDHAVGDLLKAMEEEGIGKNTLIVLTSDHGEGLGEHGENTHGIFIYDATVHVPLILSCPGILPEGDIFAAQVGLIDVMPTVLELMGWQKRNDVQGRSLVPLIENKGPAAGGYTYIESLSPLLSRNWSPLLGIRTAEWKYIEAPKAELYNLREDPEEKTNIIADEADIALKLRRELKGIIDSSPSRPSAEEQGRSIDTETRRKLSSLGYISGGFPSTGTGGEKPDPKDMIALDNLFNDAIIASETGDLESAQTSFEEVLQEQPDFAIAYEYAAYNLYKWGKPQEAINLLERALTRGLTHSTILARLGLYYQETGRIEDSLAVLEQAASNDPGYAEVFNYLGVSLFKSGRIEDSAAAFRKALSLDTNSSMAMNNLGNAFLALGELDFAEEEYRKAIAVDRFLASAHNGLAVVLYRKGKTEEALKEWAISIDIDPDQPDALYNLGKIHLKLGNRNEALRFLSLFVGTAPPWKYAKDLEEVRKIIELLKKGIRESRAYAGEQQEGVR